MNWNRKYRPNKIAGLHLTTVRKQMQTLVEQGKIPQALLFAGPKGTGKTSTARILGALLNASENEAAVEEYFFEDNKKTNEKLKDLTTLSDLGEKILSGESYIVQEMDAASNRGIDDIRSLKERIMLPPQEGKMSVYILDEAHMLTTEAFNALLKILEEPPSHVVFILATTEMHKIPDTIVSRCQVIHFRKATTKEITTALTDVLKSEGVSYDEAALKLIAERADGSFRDAIKLLEVAAGEGDVTLEAVETFVTTSLTEEITNLITAVIDKDAQTVVGLFKELRDQNVNDDHFYKQLMQTLHNELEKHYDLETGDTFISNTATQFLLSELLDETFALPTPIPHLPLELKLLEIIDRAKKNGKNANNAATSKKKVKKVIPPEKVQVVTEAIVTPQQKDTIAQYTSTSNGGNGKKLLDNWHEFVARVSEKNSTLGALFQSAHPISAEDGKIAIGVYYQFHQEQLSSKKFSDLTQPIIDEICEGPIQVSVVLSEPPTEADLKDPELKADKIPALAQVATEALM